MLKVEGRSGEEREGGKGNMRDGEENRR